MNLNAAATARKKKIEKAAMTQLGQSKVVVGISHEEDPDNSATPQDSGINRVIDVVREVLRDKKGGTPALS